MEYKSIEREVLAAFTFLCQTPHPPKAEAVLATHLAERLRAQGLKPWQDARGNLVCDLPASQGMEHKPLTAVQAHLDMVCAVGSASYVPERDAIHPIERDGFLCTAGESSLGADCGAGAAVMLWLADHPEIQHPPLRLLFTVEEEIGLCGARDLDPTCLEGIRFLVNTDGFHWGRIVTGAAGGVRERYTRPLTWANAPKLPNGRAYRLSWSGLRGGHSGFDIGARRANAVLLMGELLREIRMESPFALADFGGGAAFNAIPYQSTAQILTIAPAKEAIQAIGARIINRCCITDPDIRLDIQEIDLPERVWNGDVSSGLLTVLGGFVDGVYAMHHTDTQAVSDSSNLGHVYVLDGQICLDAMIRCMDRQAEQAMITSHRAVCGMCGFERHVVSQYPAWRDQSDTDLTRWAADCYKQVTGQCCETTVQHVGLEPSRLLEKNPDMSCICVGMELYDCHSPQERWKLDTIAPFVDMLTRLIARIANS